MTEMTKEKFTEALSELVRMSMDAGLHTSEMIGPVKKELLWLRQNAMPSKAADAYNAEHGLPRMTAAELRELLHLESYEPIPPQREQN